MRACIAGWGAAVPDGRVTNADLEQRVETSDQWIVERTGIRERRVAGPEDSTATLAIAAGAAAIKQAGITPLDIELLIVATATPEQPIPHTGAFVGEGLGLRCGSFDLGAGCAGFVYELVTGASLLASGGLGHVLVIGAETLSRIVDPNDRATCILFGDAAAALVLEAVPDDGPGLLSFDLGCDGSLAGLLEVSAGGSRRPTTEATLAEGLQYLKMQGPEVFRRAVRVVVESANTAMVKADVASSQIDWFIPHQANARIIDAVSSRLGIHPERTIVNIERYGNTSAASIPLALSEAADAGQFEDGDLILVSGFGAGMTWGSAVLRWGRA
jgi:3-oxoacyl-[acyl-carrier-protein] synthase-3